MKKILSLFVIFCTLFLNSACSSSFSSNKKTEEVLFANYDIVSVKKDYRTYRISAVQPLRYADIIIVKYIDGYEIKEVWEDIEDADITISDKSEYCIYKKYVSGYADDVKFVRSELDCTKKFLLSQDMYDSLKLKE